MSTFTRNSAYGSAKVSTVGYGVEVELMLNAGDRPAVFGGIPHPNTRGDWSQPYRGAPFTTATTTDVAPSALVQGY